MAGALGIAALAAPTTGWAVPLAAGTDSDVVRLFVIVGVMLIVGKLAGELSERIRQPAVLGELIAGALLGGSAIGLIPTAPDDALSDVIHILAEIGVVVLLFEIGLETDLKEMFRVGPGALAVALVGVALPMLGGILFWNSPLSQPEFGLVASSTTAIFIGAALTATSVGITARVLRDLNVFRAIESKLIIGAAVVDDVLGLVLLGLVSSLAVGNAVTFGSVSRSLGVAVGFLVISIAVGLMVAPKLFDLVDRMRVRGMLLVAAFAFLLLFAALADFAGSAMIIGAFAAGLVLSGINQFNAVEERIKPVADVFTPIFFLSIGAQFDLTLLNFLDPENLPVLGMGLSLTIIAIIGKLAAGWAAPWRKYNRLAVGLGMMPRGEVGLIFANIGLVTGVLSNELFGAIILMVIGTTFITPPLLKWSFGKYGVTAPEDEGPRQLEPLEDADGET